MELVYRDDKVGIEGITIIRLLLSIFAIAENPQQVLFTTQIHGDTLGSTFFVASSDAREHAAPGFPRLIPCGDLFSSNRADRRVLLVEVELAVLYA